MSSEPIAAGDLLGALPFVIALSLVGVLYSQPFEGAMIRMRAHFAPKSISLDGEETRTTPELQGIFATLQRTMALEGWWGVYKGAYATVVGAIAIVIPTVLFMAFCVVFGVSPPVKIPATMTVFQLHSNLFFKKVDATAAHMSPVAFQLITLVFALLLLVISIPVTIIINRAIVTPYKLPLSINGSLRILLSRRERNRPYVLLCTPGLVAGVLLSALVPGAISLVMDTLHIAPRDGQVRAIVWVGLTTLSAAWVVPFKVIICKVSVQTNLFPAAGVGEQELLLTESFEDAEEDRAGAVRCSSSDEDVVNIRPALPKYTSLYNAYQTIIAEEGWQALYRGWIWTALGLFIAALGKIPDYAPPQVPRH